MDKIRTGQFIIDDKNKQLTFLDVRFYGTEDGEYIPSVTTILDAYPKSPAFFEWLKKNGDEADNIRDAAGEKGSMVHQLTERYDNGEPVTLIDADGRIRYKAAEWNMFERYVEFTKTVNSKVIRNEYNIVSEKLGTAGTIDRNIEFEKLGNFIMDIKTSNSIYAHYWCQLAAYKKLHEGAFPDEKIDGVCILWLNAKTRGDKVGKFQGKGWQLIFPDRDIEHYWNVFRHTQALWNEVNADLKPKNIVYNLEHKK